MRADVQNLFIGIHMLYLAHETIVNGKIGVMSPGFDHDKRHVRQKQQWAILLTLMVRTGLVIWYSGATARLPVRLP